MAHRLIVIFGATGDLAQRMLYPSLYFLDGERLIPDDLVIVGCSRKDLGDDAFAARTEASVPTRTEQSPSSMKTPCGAARSRSLESRSRRPLAEATSGRQLIVRIDLSQKRRTGQ